MATYVSVQCLKFIPFLPWHVDSNLQHTHPPCIFATILNCFNESIYIISFFFSSFFNTTFQFANFSILSSCINILHSLLESSSIPKGFNEYFDRFYYQEDNSMLLLWNIQFLQGWSFHYLIRNHYFFYSWSMQLD